VPVKIARIGRAKAAGIVLFVQSAGLRNAVDYADHALAFVNREKIADRENLSLIGGHIVSAGVICQPLSNGSADAFERLDRELYLSLPWTKYLTVGAQRARCKLAQTLQYVQKAGWEQMGDETWHTTKHGAIQQAR
jgi:hypothetical protein